MASPKKVCLQGYFKLENPKRCFPLFTRNHTAFSHITKQPRHQDTHQHNASFALPSHRLSLFEGVFYNLLKRLRFQEPTCFKKRLTLWLQDLPFYTEADSSTDEHDELTLHSL